MSRFLRKVSDTIIKLDTAVAVGDISPTELAGVWEELTHAIYQRIIITGATFVGVELTPAAKAHGLHALLPEEVEVGEANWRARPGSDPRFSVPPAERVIRIPIAGRDEWERAAQ